MRFYPTRRAWLFDKAHKAAKNVALDLVLDHPVDDPALQALIAAIDLLKTARKLARSRA
jgi:hypothetical protein